MRDRLFRAIAGAFPTEKLATNPALRVLWRTLFYAVRPAKPFVMRTPHYRVLAHPKKGTLTRSIIIRGRWEPAETRAFARFLRPGAFVIDAGANFGHYALLSANAVGEQGLVVAFEPDPATFALLASNAGLLSAANLVVEQAGLSDQTGSIALAVDARNPGGHSFARENVDTFGHSVDVPVFRLDDFVVERGMNRRVDLVKIDVQGFEWKMICGAQETLKRDRPVVFCEVSPSMMAAVDDDFHVLLRFFEELGYDVAAVDVDGKDVCSITYQTAARMLADPGSVHGDPTRQHLDLIFSPAQPSESP